MFKHKTLIVISGLLWFLVGSILLTRGVSLVYDKAIWLIAFCFIIGALKGRFILSKSVGRIIKRITSLKEPVPIYKIYNPSYYLLIGSMISLGILLRNLNLIIEVRAAFDITIGSALINGSLVMFASIPTQLSREALK